MIIHAFGVLASPLQVSALLTNLRISHSIIASDLQATETQIHNSKKQPAWPIIVPSIAALARYKCEYDNQIILLCDSFAMLSSCNVHIIKPENMDYGMRSALKYATDNTAIDGWKLKRKETSINEYVTSATKPSLLNDVQSLLYRVSNYSLRKEAQTLIIGYLAGTESKSKLMAKLSSSYKLDDLKALMKDPLCDNLKDAVDAYKKTKNVEIAASAHNISTFEIMYIFQSAMKTK